MGFLILLAGPLYVLIAAAGSAALPPVDHGAVAARAVSEIKTPVVVRDYSACQDANGSYNQDCVTTIAALAIISKKPITKPSTLPMCRIPKAGGVQCAEEGEE